MKLLFIASLVVWTGYAQGRLDSLIQQKTDENSFAEVIALADVNSDSTLLAQSLYLIGYCYAVEKKDYKKSFEYIQRAIERGPATGRMYYNQALNCHYLGDDSTALRYSDLGIQLEPSAAFMYKFNGWMNVRLNNYPAAIRSYQTGLELDSTDYYAMQSLIQAFIHEKRLSDANKYRRMLKRAYLRRQLPEDLKYYYIIDWFKWRDKVFVTKEAYPDAGEPETEGSFSKLVLFVYNSRDEEECCFEAVKIHQIEPSESKYVMTKRIYKNNRLAHSQSYWSFTFPISIDYLEFRNAAICILEGGVNSDAESIFKTD